MLDDSWPRIEEARQAALEVLHHNMRGSCQGLPRAAGWGYPEPYTRDLLLSAFGSLVTRDPPLMKSLRKVLQTLAETQTPHGHIASIAHDPSNLGAADTTPLFLLILALYRRVSGEDDFLEDNAQRALNWMDYQSPEDRVIVEQQPTTDWRDEQWVPGYGLYVNCLTYTFLKLWGRHERAATLYNIMHRFAVTDHELQSHVHRDLVIDDRPYFAFWAFKDFRSERFDLMGNSLAILSGLAAPSRARKICAWVQREVEHLRQEGDLTVDLPPVLFPFMHPGDPDWRRRDERFNQPGRYLNGGVWPFVCGFYVAACVAAGEREMAERNLATLTELVRSSRDHDVAWGFNEWHQAQTGEPCGEDWQSWSAALYLYAAHCVEHGETPFFDDVRASSPQLDDTPAG